MEPILVLDPEAEAFAAALRAHLPGRAVLTARPAQDEEVPYLVTGTPPPGLLAGLLGLRLVLSLNAGVDRLLGQEALPPGVRLVKMADEGLKAAMTEWVLAQVLAWHRNLWIYEEQRRCGIWERRSERLARERRVAVLGAGALALSAAGGLLTLGFGVEAWGRTEGEREGVVVRAGAAGLRKVLAGADILVNLLPLTEETRNLIGRELFSELRPGALFINGGRGATVCEPALLEALGSGVLSLAVLDVFPVEPLPAEHRFWTHPAVRISPHAAAVTRPDTAAAAVAASICAFERGEVLAHLADPLRGY